MNDPVLFNKFAGCIIGGEIGDRLGMSVESMTREEILAATGGKGVTTFIDPIQTKIASLVKLKAGDYTDDTQLTRATTRGIIRARGINLPDIAREHVIEYDRSSAGWGRSTKNSVVRWRENQFRGSMNVHLHIPEINKTGAGCGNGVAMKVAPLALFHIKTEQNLLSPAFQDIIAFGLLTHPDIRASLAACAVATVIEDGFKDIGQQKLKSWLIRSIGYCDAIYQVDPENSLTRKLEITLSDEILGDYERLIGEIGTGCFSLESVPLAIAIYFRNRDDYEAGILEAVNAGGDTDTIAAMVGNMIGARVGLSGIPERFKNFRSDFLESIPLVTQFMSVL